ncbi:MAG: hypothetical protein GX489_06865 [Firmicutes bacterium]|nr:hypothetical protein [Bacillota bacterium]
MSIFNVTVLNPEPEYKKRVIELTGTPYEQGVVHGRAAKDLIRCNLEVVRQRIGDRLESNVMKLLKENEAFVSQYQPELWQELQGLAEGSELPLEEIALINLPLYFVLGWLQQECSQFTKVLTDQNGNTHTVAVKTRDMGEGPYEHVVLLRQYPNGLEMAEVGLAGIVTFPGSVLTSRGIAVTTSGVWCPRTPFDPAEVNKGEILPNSHLLAENISTIEDAPKYQEATPRLTGLNYVLASAGKAAGFEVTRDKATLFEPSDTAVRTNHFLSPEYSYLSPTVAEGPSSYSRFRRITELLATAESVHDIWSIARDHEGYPQNCVCRHKDDTGKGSVTIYASLFIIETNQVFVVFGNPCECEVSPSIFAIEGR